MSGERIWPAATRERARLHAALADPARVAIIDEVRVGDRSPAELAAGLDLASNLLAHHLSVLRRAGLVDRVRSEADRRRTYVRLCHAAPAVTGRGGDDGRTGPEPDSRRLVFVCTHNSARSQFAAASWRDRVGGAATSAGTEPAQRVHPGAVVAARRRGIDLSGATPAALAAELAGDDLVVVVCDRAYEALPRDRTVLHWSVPDPVHQDSADAFDRAFDDITERIHRLAPWSAR